MEGPLALLQGHTRSMDVLRWAGASKAGIDGDPTASGWAYLRVDN